MPHTYTDEALINAIREGGIPRRRAADWLHRQYYGFIPKAKKQYGLSEDDAITAYLEAVSRVVRAVEEGRFQGDSKVFTYFYRIFSNCCVDISRARTSNRTVHDDLDAVQHLADYAQDQLRALVQGERWQQLVVIMEELGKNCKELLIATEVEGYRIKEVFQAFGFKNASTASQTKYRCLERFRAAVQASSLF